jgi:hypothetical protein
MDNGVNVYLAWVIGEQTKRGYVKCLKTSRGATKVSFLSAPHPLPSPPPPSYSFMNQSKRSQFLENLLCITWQQPTPTTGGQREKSDRKSEVFYPFLPHCLPHRSEQAHSWMSTAAIRSSSEPSMPQSLVVSFGQHWDQRFGSRLQPQQGAPRHVSHQWGYGFADRAVIINC